MRLLFIGFSVVSGLFSVECVWADGGWVSALNAKKQTRNIFYNGNINQAYCTEVVANYGSLLYPKRNFGKEECKNL
ncbi:hypothetical protein OC25_06740 [Pedobacter kyungheensis]|uniref:Uncharacterized protein n=1 Tax=Pedobacter kyungheensis TaxID=1069985 RepID=A0A0C1DCZ4_9SPHI|nr:hypothetical protein OC25_06740 [Pedobacter kyungheensis]